MSIETRETSHDIYQGHTLVGTTAVRLTDIVTDAYRGVILKCPGKPVPNPNDATVWVGNARVTANSDPNTGGMPIAPGESMTIQIRAASKLFVISTSEGQDIAWMAL